MSHCLPHTRAAFAAFASTLIAVAIPAQQDLTEVVLQLADEDLQPRAVDRLVQAGEACVPLLAPLLHRCGDSDEPPVQQLYGALEVLRRLRGAALAARTAIEDAYRFAGDPEVRNRAMIALVEVAVASGDKQQFQTARRLLETDNTPELDAFRFQFATYRLNLGPNPEARTLQRLVSFGHVYAHAAAHAARDQDELPEDVLEAMETALERALRREALPWLNDTRYAYTTGLLAEALHRHGRPPGRLQRGLLVCDDAKLRRAALMDLQDYPRWTQAQRYDVVSVMWDRDRQTRELAVAALTGAGAEGLIGLRAMRAFEAWEREHGRDRRAAYYARCAEQLVAAAAERGENAAEVVRRADAALRNAPIDDAPLVADEAALELLAAIVFGCRGADNGAGVRLAALARSMGAVPFPTVAPLRQAFLSLLGGTGDTSWIAAEDTLIALGPSCAAPEPGNPAFDELLLEAILAGGRREEELWPLEALVLAGPAATVDELRGALRAPRWHISLRAAVELTARGALAVGDREALRMLTEVGEDRLRTATTRRFAELTSRGGSAACMPPVSQLRAACALGLCAIGDQPWNEAELAEALAIELDCEVRNLEVLLTGHRDRGSLGDLARSVERHAWQFCGWPIRR